MNSLFKKALNFVLKWEGGYANNPNDKGGATNKGITQSTYNNWLTAKKLPSKNIQYITDAEVEQIYYQNYWIKAGCDKMSSKFALLAFDTAVNMGVSRVQEFLKAANWKDENLFILARAKKYNEFAKVPSQRIFLHGWLNRLFDLQTFISN